MNSVTGHSVELDDRLLLSGLDRVYELRHLYAWLLNLQTLSPNDTSESMTE